MIIMLQLETGIIFGTAFTLPIILISSFIPVQPYENLNISKFDSTGEDYKTVNFHSRLYGFKLFN